MLRKMDQKTIDSLNELKKQVEQALKDRDSLTA